MQTENATIGRHVAGQRGHRAADHAGHDERQEDLREPGVRARRTGRRPGPRRAPVAAAPRVKRRAQDRRRRRIRRRAPEAPPVRRRSAKRQQHEQEPGRRARAAAGCPANTSTVPSATARFSAATIGSALEQAGEQRGLGARAAAWGARAPPARAPRLLAGGPCASWSARSLSASAPPTNKSALRMRAPACACETGLRDFLLHCTIFSLNDA